MLTGVKASIVGAAVVNWALTWAAICLGFAAVRRDLAADRLSALAVVCPPRTVVLIEGDPAHAQARGGFPP